ncbi:helix-turn-helix domain-containing protein [Viridibacillus arvi]|uniref:helix-turn-helix domain-containing protein n=1 Tax=Viridibacillus arvi TaxID=263475 RepID=UPI003CFE8559
MKNKNLQNGIVEKNIQKESFSSKPNGFEYLKKHKTFNSIAEMDEAVKKHKTIHSNKLSDTDKYLLERISQHSLNYPGVCHVKASTLANEIGKSTKTIYRSTSKLAELDIIEKIDGTKLNGIKGASIYKILPIDETQCSTQCLIDNVPTEVSYRSNTQNTQYNRVSEENFKKQSLNSLITNSFYPLKDYTKNTYPATQMSQRIQNVLIEKLKIIYYTQPLEKQRDFKEFYKAIPGLYKEHKDSFDEEVIEEVMMDVMIKLITLTGIRNEVGKFTSMVRYRFKALAYKKENALLKKHINYGAQITYQNRTAMVPDWFGEWIDKRNDPSQTNSNHPDTYFEEEKKKVLAKLKG